MRLVDTHSHLDFPDYKNDLDEVLGRAAESGVIRVIVPGTSAASSEKAVKLAAAYPGVFSAAGIHPHEADKVGDNDIARIRDLAVNSDKIVAIGEIGLDYFKGYSKKENQRKLFRRLLSIANELELPAILHNRDADGDFLEILSEVMPQAKGVMHCYSSKPPAFLEEMLSRGMYISFAGNITFEKAEELRKIVKRVPPERLLLETDSPYITPEPSRGKRNEPGYVKYLLETYSGIYRLSTSDIARITTHNANQLFHLGIEEKPAIAYPIRNSLYLNITNRCTNRCAFCTRQYSNYAKGHNLKLNAEPASSEIIEAMGDVSGYNEVVFCGYGEPTLRLEAIKKVASYVKEKGTKVRLTTNGEGNLISERRISSELKGLVDRVSVSLNAPNEEGYDRLCRSVFGRRAYKAILDFIAECREDKIEVEVTCLDIIGEEAVEECRKMVEARGALFRLRHEGAVG